MLNKFDWIKWALISVVLILVVGSIYHMGYSKAEDKYQSELQVLKLEYAEAALIAEQEYSEKLKQAQAQKDFWFEQAGQLDKKLVTVNQAIIASKQQLKKDIDYAIASDKKNANTNCGLGTHSLQLYTRALGYTD